MATRPGVAVELQGAVVRRGRHVVLRGCDLTIGQGVTGVIGRNGSGKTSLLRVLATVSPPSAGRLRIAGHATEVLDGLRRARSSLGYLPQDWEPPGSARVVDLVRHAAWMHRMPGGDAAVERILDRLDLARHRSAMIMRLSTGTRRRVGLAQALIHDPDVLLLDEPTAGLDAEQRERLWRILDERSGDQALIMVSHDPSEVTQRFDRLLLVSDGRARLGDVDAFAHEHGHRW